MLLNNQLYKIYAKNIRNEKLPEKLQKESIGKNKRTEMLLKNLLFKCYAKNNRSKTLPHKLR